jgi:hypothetical protein
MCGEKQRFVEDFVNCLKNLWQYLSLEPPLDPISHRTVRLFSGWLTDELTNWLAG